MDLSNFDFHLPTERIAQQPAEPRDSARLLLYDRKTDSISHHIVRDLPDLLPNNTTVTVNNSRVRHSRLQAEAQGKTIEILVVEPIKGNLYRCIIRGRKLADGTSFTFPGQPGRNATLVGREDHPAMQTYRVAFDGNDPESWFEEAGSLPLPPYIHRSLTDDERYQTVYSQQTGSAAAPTAGLHFTPELMAKLESQGHALRQLTLHVGLGTFIPLRETTVENNVLHKEHTSMESGLATELTAVVQENRPLLAVGTTSLRTLESHWNGHAFDPGDQATEIFIYPGKRIATASAMLTNFHLPKSSLFVLVAAFVAHDANRDIVLQPDEAVARLQRVYREAIERDYRFYSLGDAMLIR